MCNLFVTAHKRLYGMIESTNAHSSLTNQPSLSFCTFSTLNGPSSSLDKVDLLGKTGYNEYVLLGDTDRVVLV
jgi:hypothetical protein